MHEAFHVMVKRTIGDGAANKAGEDLLRFLERNDAEAFAHIQNHLEVNYDFDGIKDAAYYEEALTALSDYLSEGNTVGLNAVSKINGFFNNVFKKTGKGLNLSDGASTFEFITRYSAKNRGEKSDAAISKFIQDNIKKEGAEPETPVVELETQETRFIFNAQRKIEQIVPLTRNDAHKMIEECMIQANVAAAKFVEKHQQAILYRVHDRPGKERLTNFRGFLNELGLPLGGGEEPQPSDYFKLVEAIQERPDLELIQTMLLRSMMQAVYQPDNIGHFGLALKSYAHFTSPIRRYPDLLLHRVIKFLVNKLEAEAAGKTVKNKWTVTGGYSYQDDEMDKFGEVCSMTERRADDATREVSDSLKCEYMQDHVGTVLPATIAAVTGFGFFARLDEFHIDGLVHINSLRGDYYHYDAARQILVGEKTGKRFRIGDAVTVKVASVNMADRKMEFVIVNKDGQADEFDRPERTGKDGGRGKRFAKSTGDSERSRDGKKKQRHRDSKNKGKRRGTAKSKSNESSSENKGGFSPWQQRDPAAKKAKSNNEANAKTRKKPKKKRKQRPGKQERNAVKQQMN